MVPNTRRIIQPTTEQRTKSQEYKTILAKSPQTRAGGECNARENDHSYDTPRTLWSEVFLGRAQRVNWEGRASAAAFMGGFDVNSDRRAYPAIRFLCDGELYGGARAFVCGEVGRKREYVF